MAYDKDPDEIGALWDKEKNGKPYMTGEINGVKVVCFMTKSDNPKAPKWRVLKAKSREAAEEPAF